MTRYELATMKVGFGVAPKAAEAIAAYATETGAGGKLLGCWFSDIGDLNTIAVLRGFADDAGASARARPHACGAAIPSAAATSWPASSWSPTLPFRACRPSNPARSARSTRSAVTS